MLPPDLDDIDRYRQFAAACFSDHPKYGQIAGASPDDLHAFRALAGRPLPALYLGYLEHFGADDGPIDLCDDCACSAAAVVRYVRKKDDPSWPIKPPNSVLIGVRALSLARALNYADSDEPTVVIHDDDFIAEVVADSFGVYLYRQTWLHRYFWQGKKVIHLRRDKEASLDDVAAALGPMGFEPTAFSDAYRYTAEREGIRVQARTDEHYLRLAVAGSELWPTANTANQIADVVEMEER